VIIIPTDSSGTIREYTEKIGLEGVAYTFKLSWNVRTETWMLSIAALDGTAIIDGVAVTCGVDLLRGCVVTGRPPGLLFAAPTDGDITRPAIDGLGSRVLLYYRESTDTAP
jgi:hypothetical protein